MIVFSGLARLLALAVAATAVLGFPKPAAADDTLVMVSGSFPTAFYEVLTDVADEAGFYKAEHLNVVENYAGAAALAVQAVGGGKGDIGAVGTEPIIQGYDKGVRMQAFFSRNPHLQQCLAVLDSSPIHTLADFKGKTLGELSLGQSGETYASVMLAGAGLKKSDYSFAAIGNGAQAIQALTTGKVDGAAFPIPELRIYEIAAHIKFRYFYEPVLKDISDVAYVASPQTIATKADVLKRFSRATAEAAILVRVNPHLAAKYFVEKSGMKVTDEAIANEEKLLDISQDLLPGNDPNNPRIGEVLPRDMGVLAQFMYDNGLAGVRVPTSAVVTNAFITYANDFDHKAFIAKAKAMH
jgi:NitT/TauT family transport system substrate-binding protein